MKKFLKILLVFNVLFLIGIVALFIINEKKIKKYQEFAEITLKDCSANDFKNFNTGYIYDSKNEVIAKLTDGEGEGEYLVYSDIPKNCVNAFIAIEDRSFWDNKGYDPKGMLRVLIDYIRSNGEKSTGASTITQQLIRLRYLTTEKTIDRKLKEIACAAYFTEHFSKKEIMEFYVNNVYFANGIYGIEAAAKSYFGKSAKDISLSQMAYLCAIPNRPSYFDPRVNPDNAMHRRNKILKDMKECDYITEKQYKKALKEKIEIKKKKKVKLRDYQTTFAIRCATEYLMKIYGFEFRYDFKSEKDFRKYLKEYRKVYNEMNDELHSGGYQITTTLDQSVQKRVQKSLDRAFSDKSKDDEGVYKLQGSLTVIDNKTGKVIAIVGGRSQKKDEYTYNRAYQNFRQPGSSIKPLLVYTPAIMKGYRDNTVVEDIDIQEAQNGNKISEMHGEKLPLRDAVEQSRNGVAYSVLNTIGINYGLDFLKEMKFSHLVPADETLSSALGGLTYGVTTLEMASGYATIANDGVYRNPDCIVSIKKGNEEIYKEEEEKEIYDPASCQRMVDILTGVLTNGTAHEVGWESNIPAAGKTGTTNSNKDGWFCGMTPYYSIAVWVGYDKPKTLDNLKGATFPAQIWKSAMTSIIEGKPVVGFSTEAIREEIEANAEEEFLPGRDGNEIIGGGGYTVNNYRADRTLGKGIMEILEKMKKAETMRDLDDLKAQANNLIEQIISIKYTSEMEGNLETSYNEAKERISEKEEEEKQKRMRENTTENSEGTSSNPNQNGTTRYRRDREDNYWNQDDSSQNTRNYYNNEDNYGTENNGQENDDWKLITNDY